jgi:hypothetical protein
MAMLKTTAALIGGAVLEVTATTTAHAATVASTDGTGDVYETTWNEETGTEEVTEAGSTTNVDVESLKVRHTARKVILTARYADLTRGEVILGAGLQMRFADAPKMGAFVDTYNSWAGEAVLYKARNGRPVDCDRLDVSIDYADDHLVVSVPRSCVGNPRWVQVNYLAYGSQEDPEAAGGWHSYRDNAHHAGPELDGWTARARKA